MMFNNKRISYQISLLEPLERASGVKCFTKERSFAIIQMFSKKHYKDISDETDNRQPAIYWPL